jgi:phospholipid-translocating ATPase
MNSLNFSLTFISYWSLFPNLFLNYKLVIIAIDVVNYLITLRTIITRLGYIITYIGPLCFVLMVTMATEARDDLKRRQRDKEANAQRYRRLGMDGEQQDVAAADITVGDLIIICKDQRVSSMMYY